jgi:AraC-like DNA-binding protein
MTDDRTVDPYPKAYLYQRIVQAKIYIDEHYAEKIDVENIADEAYFSKFHFIRLFKKAVGRTPHQYLTWVRVHKAKELLEGEHSITDVCFAVGFESPGAFATVFKRVAGETPSAYQVRLAERHKREQERPIEFVPACFVPAFQDHPATV